MFNAIRQAVDLIQGGERECDVAEKIYHTQIVGTEEFAEDYPAIVASMPFGTKSNCSISPSERALQNTKQVIRSLLSSGKRYHLLIARTVVMGALQAKVLDLTNVVVEGLGTALDAVRWCDLWRHRAGLA